MGDIVSPDKIEKYERLKIAIITGDIIFIYGPPASGKTYLARRALDRNESVSYAYVDCNIVTTPTKLYVQILSSLRDALKFSNKRTRGRRVELPKLLGYTDFLSVYQELVEFGHRKGSHRIYVVLDRIDCLLKTGMINTLQPIIDRDVLNLICISNPDPRDILSGLKSTVDKVSFNSSRICIIQIQAHSKGELVDLICMDEPRVDPELYRKFVNNVVNLLHTDRTRDLHDMRTFCQQNYPEFYRYYEGKFKEIIRKKEKILDELDVSLDDFELDQVSCSAIIMGFLNMMREKIAKKDMHTWNQAGEKIDRQVVLCTSVLIIAAYVAAYTKPSDDKKNFIKFQKRKVVNRVDRNEGNDIKAKPFTMERLLHIYRGILTSIQRGDNEDKTEKDNDYADVQLTDSVLGDVSQLERLGMIEVVTGDSCDAQLRYRISARVGRKYVDRIAEQINFSLKYIYGLNY